jgi:hypothetical protein
MIQNTANKPISELFSADNAVSYYIPKYQREYVWNKWNWEALFDDIDESSGGHFMGSIICINTQLDSHKPAELELVDGQQRMTTLSLLYLSIYKYLKANMPDPTNMDDLLELHSLRNRIASSATAKLLPSITSHNAADYLYIFSQEIQMPKTAPKPSHHGLRLIPKAYRYFNERFNAMNTEGKPNFTHDQVKEFLKKLNSATLVKIDVATHSDAFTLFETLNNRGVPLSAIDLIKNKLLGQLEKVDKSSSINARYERWLQIINNLSSNNPSDDYSNQERFLRQFYNAFKLEPALEVAKATKAIRSNLIRVYEELINRSANFLFDRLENASLIYAKNIKCDDDEHSSKLRTSLRNLENVFGVDAYMLLMFIEHKFQILPAVKIQIVDLLCIYFIRRNVTDTPPTRDLTNIFISILAELDKLESFEVSTLRNLLLTLGRPASDKVFEEKLKGDLYEENVGATRYILTSIELHLKQTTENDVNFYKREKNQYVWTIEHILPQGDNLPKQWIDMIAYGDKEAAIEVQKNWAHKLGNLTLTGYNANLSNLPLDKKQGKTNSEGKAIGFKNGLGLNEEVKDCAVWRQSEIEARTKYLVDLALQIFTL